MDIMQREKVSLVTFKRRCEEITPANIRVRAMAADEP